MMELGQENQKNMLLKKFITLIQLVIFKFIDKNDIYHQFFSDCNHDQIYRKNLCILTNINNNHYNLLFDKKYNCFKNTENRLIFYII